MLELARVDLLLRKVSELGDPLEVLGAVLRAIEVVSLEHLVCKVTLGSFNGLGSGRSRRGSGEGRSGKERGGNGLGELHNGE